MSWGGSGSGVTTGSHGDDNHDDCYTEGKCGMMQKANDVSIGRVRSSRLLQLLRKNCNDPEREMNRLKDHCRQLVSSVKAFVIVHCLWPWPSLNNRVFQILFPTHARNR